MTIQDDLRTYIVNDLGWSGDPQTLTDELDLVENQIIDSLSVVELSALLEQWYTIKVDATDLVYDNFHSLKAIATFVDNKRFSS